jgi:flagellar protein FliO/FliZ
MRWWLIRLTAFPLLAARLPAGGDLLLPSASGTPNPIVAPSPGLGMPTLVVAVFCAAAGAWFLWKGKRQSVLRAGKGNLTVAETRSLGNRQYLVVAAYGRQKFLIGVCAGRISLLSPLDDSSQPPAS